MTVKRFFGATARDCLRQVKEALGPEAVVISNKAVPGGVEIVAMTPESLAAVSASDAPPPRATTARPAMTSAATTPAATMPESDDYTVTLSAARRAARSAATEASPVVRPWTPPPANREATVARALSGEAQSVVAAGGSPATPWAAGAISGDMEPARQPAVMPAASSASSTSAMPSEQLLEEMRGIRQLLERQLSGFAWGEAAREAPVRVLLLGEMLAAGFSGALTRRLVNEMPADLRPEEGRKWLNAAVNRRLRTLPAEADLIDRGGVYALVGPTGSGKTTTTAKLAARCVVRHGADKLALLTTDGYRIGAHEQLRIYGRILGVPVFVVRDAEDLRRTLADLRNKHMVLIDTVGMSQRDRMVADQVAMLTRAGEVNRLLLLNAGSRGEMLDDVVRAYGGDDLAGVILTKIDEALALAPALDCVVRHGLSLSYLANGQRVPEDLHLPNRDYLLHRAFKVGAGETAHSLRADEVPLAFAERAPLGEGEATTVGAG
jgi:flagellar biosynthesis protein FlhF